MSDSNSTSVADPSKSLRSPLIVLRVKVDQAEKAFFGYATNISRSGLFIATTNPRQAENHFVIEFALPDPLGCQVQCTCAVVWSRQYSRKSIYGPGMGLKFVDLPEELAEAIDAWVQHRLPCPTVET
ncbi:MAG: PilZ domain-containing protein [Desulfuromonadaceae bacterium]